MAVARRPEPITDLFRKKWPEPLDATIAAGEDEPGQLDDLLPSPDAGPDALYARRLVLEELALALEELPEEQREVFIAHEIEGQSFRDIAEATGIGINTLLSRKHYAVRYLRARLRQIFDEFTQA